VDRDGHVAFFDTGEAGAVPLDALAGDDAYQARQRLAQLLPRGESIQDLRGRLRPGAHGQAHWPRPPREGYALLMFLRSVDPVNEEIAAGRAFSVPTSEGNGVIIRGNMDEALFRRLHENGDCLGCFYHPSEEYEEEWPDLAAHGIYRYGHLTENWISGPYGRESLPARPVHVDQLPPALRNQVKRMRFDLRFAETPFIQPVEHTECASWEAAYLDCAGKKIRPFPGKEDEYRDAYGDLKDQVNFNFEVEPPAEE
jgi:hypothetical protein